MCYVLFFSPFVLQFVTILVCYMVNRVKNLKKLLYLIIIQEKDGCLLLETVSLLSTGAGAAPPDIGSFVGFWK